MTLSSATRATLISDEVVRRTVKGSSYYDRKARGECVQCGSEIEPKRLEAIPWARYCLKCQELVEHK